MGPCKSSSSLIVPVPKRPKIRMGTIRPSQNNLNCFKSFFFWALKEWEIVPPLPTRNSPEGETFPPMGEGMSQVVFSPSGCSFDPLEGDAIRTLGCLLSQRKAEQGAGSLFGRPFPPGGPPLRPLATVRPWPIIGGGVGLPFTQFSFTKFFFDFVVKIVKPLF